jgi:Tfp pilus assembly protein PilV
LYPILKTDHGFTLIESLIAAAVLVCGLVAVASIFSFAIRSNGTNRQMAIGTTLLYDKMEQFKSASFTDPVWTIPTGSETLLVGGERYVRTWRIGGDVPRTVTVIVEAEKNALTRRRTELIRATTLLSPTF